MSWPSGLRAAGGWTAAAAALAVGLLLGAGSCANGGDEDQAGDGPTELTISVAASLAPVVDELITSYEAARPGVELTINLGSSTQLAAQIREGAPVDAIIAADRLTTESLRSDDHVSEPIALATNELAIVVAAPAAGAVRSIGDLTGLDIVALCQQEAPCGRLSREALDEAGVELDPSHIALGTDASATLRLVTDGDADAAIVYVTDAARADDATTVSIPPEHNVETTLTAAAVSDRDSGVDPDVEAFLEWLTSPGAVDILLDAGFGPVTGATDP